MEDTWKWEPDDRPTFAEITQRLENMFITSSVEEGISTYFWSIYVISPMFQNLRPKCFTHTCMFYLFSGLLYFLCMVFMYVLYEFSSLFQIFACYMFIFKGRVRRYRYTYIGELSLDSAERTWSLILPVISHFTHDLSFYTWFFPVFSIEKVSILCHCPDPPPQFCRTLLSLLMPYSDFTHFTYSNIKLLKV